MKEPVKKVVLKTAKPKTVKVTAKPLKELKIAAKPKKKVVAKKSAPKASPVVEPKIQAETPASPPPAQLVGKFRLPTLQEELFAFKQTVWDLNLHRTVTMNEKEIFKILVRYDHWVGAHSAHNGERSDAAIAANVNNAFWEHIVQAAPK